VTLDPFRTRDHIANFDKIVRELSVRSEATRSALRMTEISYGRDRTETFDLFFPRETRGPAPVHMFIHGGYWRMFSKRDFSYVAETITAAGAIAAIVDYALMPSVRMAVPVDQVRRAQTWLIANIAAYGGDPKRVTASGHSAGAHLCALSLADGQPATGMKAALLLGGLCELKPLQSSFLQSEIGITHEEVERFTPLTRSYKNSNVITTVLVGEHETAPFHAHARAFAKHLREEGLRVTHEVLPESNHMSSVRDLGIIESDTGRYLAALIRNH
jgi:arylformamidase